MCDELGGHMLAAYVEQALADVDIRQTRWQSAAGRLGRALQAQEKLACADGLAETLRSTGDLAAAQGRWTDAIDWLQRALHMWRDVQEHVETARTLVRLDRAYTAVGDEEAAAACRREYGAVRAVRTELKLDDACLYRGLAS
jgi:tetratricopeptide (TPR) repeat protein